MYNITDETFRWVSCSRIFGTCVKLILSVGEISSNGVYLSGQKKGWHFFSLSISKKSLNNERNTCKKSVINNKYATAGWKSQKTDMHRSLNLSKLYFIIYSHSNVLSHRKWFSLKTNSNVYSLNFFTENDW